LVFRIENLAINGTGAAQPTGVLNAPCLITCDKLENQSPATLMSENVDAMLSRLFSWSRRSAIFLYNSELLPQFRKLTIVTGGIFSESRLWAWACGNDEFDRLGGIPALPCEYCQPPGTTGDLILLDPTRIMIVLRELLKADLSIHIRFLTEENAYRVIIRSNSIPVDTRPVTPLHVLLTKSSCIALATRS
jgi:HK97 family phage major capsid protein